MSEEVSSTSDSGPRPIQIVKINDESEEHSFYLDEDALNDILNKDDIRDKPLCIISVAGESCFNFILCRVSKIF